MDQINWMEKLRFKSEVTIKPQKWPKQRFCYLFKVSTPNRSFVCEYFEVFRWPAQFLAPFFVQIAKIPNGKWWIWELFPDISGFWAALTYFIESEKQNYLENLTKFTTFAMKFFQFGRFMHSLAILSAKNMEPIEIWFSMAKISNFVSGLKYHTFELITTKTILRNKGLKL